MEHERKTRRVRWVFIGDNIDGFRVWHKSERCVIQSKDVEFGKEDTGRLLTLFPEKNNETNELPTQKRNDVSDPGNQSTVSVSECHADSKEESKIDTLQVSETPLSTTGRQLRDKKILKAPKCLIELMVVEVNEPKNYTEAMMSAEKAHWSTAMEEEMTSFEENSGI